MSNTWREELRNIDPDLYAQAEAELAEQRERYAVEIEAFAVQMADEIAAFIRWCEFLERIYGTGWHPTD